MSLLPRAVRCAALLVVSLTCAASVSAAVLPFFFEPLAGGAGFAARARNGTLVVEPDALVLRVAAPGAPRPLRLRWIDASPGGVLQGAAPLAARVQHFDGADPARWRRGVPAFARVERAGLHPGIDVVYYGRDGHVEHDLIVAPGADPARARLELIGADAASIDARGDLVVAVAGAEVRLHAPVSYQERDGAREPVPSRWVLEGSRAHVAVGAYDRARPLVIDPVLSYASYFGGNGEDNGGGIHVDATGVTFGGLTTSTDLPEQTTASGFDSFVAKLDPTGATLLWVTYVGGSGDETQRDLVVDAAGDAYLYGETTSSDLPTTVGAHDRSCGADGLCGGGHDAFVAKLDGDDGGLVWSTYLGGAGSDVAGKITVDAESSAYVSGYTNSSDFPATEGAYDETCGTDGTCNETFEPERVVRRDCFAAKLAADGSALAYGTYLGGSAFDRCFGVDVDASGRAIVAGSTFSADFPATPGAYDTQCGNDGACDAADDGFAAMLTADGSDLVYATFLGGGGNGDAEIDEYGWTVDAAPDGRARIAGQTDSADFPAPNGADASFGGGLDGFVAELDPTGATLAFASFLGGAGSDQALDVDVDALGRIHVSGVTTSSDLVQVRPLPGPGNACANCFLGFTEAFVTSLDPRGTRVLFSTFLGGTSSDYGSNLTVADAHPARGTALWVLGDAASTDFPTRDPYQAAHDPGPVNYDAFLVRLPEPVSLHAGATLALALRWLAARRRQRRCGSTSSA